MLLPKSLLLLLLCTDDEEYGLIRREAHTLSTLEEEVELSSDRRPVYGQDDPFTMFFT